VTEPCDAHHDGHDCSAPGACGRALLAMLGRVEDRPRLEREREELLAELRDPARQRVRRNLIAHETADYVPCPHCLVGPGRACVTFPRGEPAQHTHAKRVHARWSQLAQESVPES
jgi:hypothetical protein